MMASTPEKTYYKIGEVVQFTGLKASVLRYWESEFRTLAPEKSGAGQRLYTRQDIDLILQIKQLLYVDKYTINGVRKKLVPARNSAKNHQNLQVAPDDLQHVLSFVRQELLSIKNSLA